MGINMLAENWTYDVVDHSTHLVATVYSKDGSRSRSFTRAVGGEAACTAYRSFMESLTDENCDGFFPKERKPKKPKAQ